jgi:hypothetical protein
MHNRISPTSVDALPTKRSEAKCRLSAVPWLQSSHHSKRSASTSAACIMASTPTHYRGESSFLRSPCTPECKDSTWIVTDIPWNDVSNRYYKTEGDLLTQQSFVWYTFLKPYCFRCSQWHPDCDYMGYNNNNNLLTSTSVTQVKLN